MNPGRCEELATVNAGEKSLPILQPVALSPAELGDPEKRRLYVNALLEGCILYQSIHADPVKTAPPGYRIQLLVKYRAPPQHRRRLVGTTVVQKGRRMRARGLIEKMSGENLAPWTIHHRSIPVAPLEMILQKLGVEYNIVKVVLAYAGDEGIV